MRAEVHPQVHPQVESHRVRLRFARIDFDLRDDLVAHGGRVVPFIRVDVHVGDFRLALIAVALDGEFDGHFRRGHVQVAATDLEKELLPYGCRLLSYMQAVRFFTDYINGDMYYKIQYPEHNLVRTKAQLRLLEEQEKVEEQMQSIIAHL